MTHPVTVTPSTTMLPPLPVASTLAFSFSRAVRALVEEPDAANMRAVQPWGSVASRSTCSRVVPSNGAEGQ